MKKVVSRIARGFFTLGLLGQGWAVVLDFDDLAGKAVPDNYGGVNWEDPVLGNYWVVDPNHLPQNNTPCALFDAGESQFEVTLTWNSPVDFVSIDLAGRDGDSVALFGGGPGEEHYGVDYRSGDIVLDGSTLARYQDQWLRITSLTIFFDSLFPGSISIDNLTFEPAPRLATIFKEDFDTFTADEGMFQEGWQVQHGQYPATDGGIWHIEARTLDRQGVVAVYVISNSDAEGELPTLQYMDESLISPEIDCTEFRDVRLEFRQNLKVFKSNDPDNFPEVFNLYVSNDPAHQNWQAKQVPFWKEAYGNTLYPRSVDISDFANGKKIKIRWRYTAKWDNWWAVDDVRVIGLADVTLTSFQANTETAEVSLAWDAPDGFFAIEASSDSSFSNPTELATGITQKQWTGADPPAASEGQRFYRVRMD
ncbi:MAG: hypothetical protein Q8Q12_03485 [bacterium]|nr:hypothetical protein [bacterium]